MKILKRRNKLDKTITVRVPDVIKAELDRLRRDAGAAGFDVGATLCESLVVTIRQIATELDVLQRKQVIQPGDTLPNSVDHNLTPSDKVRAA